MKKNFFKKLSFVLASAMVLTALAPASGAFAAKGPKLNASEKYLFVGEAKSRSEYNFNISNKKSGWKYEWASLDEDVVEVNKKNGVAKAVGIGTTKVAVTITNKDGELLHELEAKVIVKDNIKEVKISNAPEGTIGVGEEYDFNRSFVTYGGSTKKTTAITRWEVVEEGASIDDKGVFVATEAGEYTVVARSFQSKSKYNSWLKDAEKYAKYVLATDETKVTVANSMVDAKQVDKDTVKVTFSSAITEEDAKKLTVSEVIGSTKVLQTISEVKLDDTNKVAEVSVYVPFDEKTVYVIDYPDMDSVQFVAATAEATDVAEIKIGTTEAEVGKPTDLKVKLYNADGVDITTDELMYRLTYDTSSATTFIDSDNKLTMFNVGETTVVTVEYHTYEYDNTTGEEIGNIKVTGVVRCVDEKAIVAEGIKAWTIGTVQTDGTVKFDFDDVKHTLAADDQNKRLMVKSVLSDDNETVVTNNDTGHLFTFTSSNENVVMVNDTTGDVYAIKAGSAVIVVKYDDKIIGTLTISVGGERKAVSLSLDTYAFTLSNSFADTKTVKLTVKDQYGESMDLEDVNKEISRPVDDEDTEDLDPENFVATPNDDNSKYTISAEGAEAGTYRVKISANGMSRTVVVTVKTPESNASTDYFRAELDKNTLDMKLKSDDLDETVTVSVYKYDKKGVRIAKVDQSSYDIEVVDPKGNEIYGEIDTDDALSKTYILASAKAGAKLGKAEEFQTVSGAAIKLEKGTYKVKVTDKSNNKVINTTYFTVSDSQVAPTFKVDKFVAKDANTLDDALFECFTFTLNGKSVTEDTDHITITDKVLYESSNKAFIKKVVVKEFLDDAKTMWINHEVNVNTSISW